MERKWIPDLWESFEIRCPNLENNDQQNKMNSFLDFQDQSEYFEVPGLLPKAANSPRLGFEPY